MEERIKKIKKCRSCYSRNLIPILSIGNIFVSQFVQEEEAGFKAPLNLILCQNCGLLQLEHTVHPELLYRTYWYKSGMNEAMLKALEDIVDKAERIIDLRDHDIVLDIGSNDSSMLRMYKRKDIIRIGFEPAYNLFEEGKKGVDKTFNSFFSFGEYKKYIKRKARIITAIAMFYDLDDPNRFINDIKKCLSKDGLLIIEQRYLPSMLEQNDIGNICHEHLEYYSFYSLKNLIDRYNLEIFDIELNNVNGGSFRVYIKHKDSNIRVFDNARERLSKIIEYETNLGLDNPLKYLEFALKAKLNANKLYNFIKTEHDRGKIIHVYGASTKGNTMLQYWNIDNSLIEAAAERDERKIGKRTIGTNIPIITERESREKADYFLVLPFHFIDAFIKREKEFLNRGGKFIVPLPYFKVIERI
uniref:Putative methyltransferase n=1 Tax=viral metagenome TaxID=1070528 RepID=A0A6M3XQ13_9ZZZZ